MAKKSCIERNKKRAQLRDKYAEVRKTLKRESLNPNISEEERDGVRRKLALLPRNASPVRFRNRCLITGRARGYWGKFGVSRLTLREYALRGLLPGVTKASW